MHPIYAGKKADRGQYGQTINDDYKNYDRVN
jgi:hypothetical protein